MRKPRVRRTTGRSALIVRGTPAGPAVIALFTAGPITTHTIVYTSLAPIFGYGHAFPTRRPVSGWIAQRTT